MTNFGDIIFKGGRFIFWTLAPAILIFLALMTLIIPVVNPVMHWSMIVGLMLAWITGFSLVLGLSNPAKYAWAFRIVTVMVFLMYCFFVLFEFSSYGDIAENPQSSDKPDTKKALLGYIVIGVPCLIYTIFGRFSFEMHPEDEPPVPDETKEDNASIDEEGKGLWKD